VGVACHLGYPCAKFRLPRPFGYQVKSRCTRHQTDRRTTDADDRLMPPGHNNDNNTNKNKITLIIIKILAENLYNCVPLL